MIFDHIKNKENYKKLPLIYQALCYLSELTEENCPCTTDILIPDKLFCNPVTLRSKPESDCVYEGHKKYIDIHYILEGVEGIATADAEQLQVKEPFDKARDIGFYEGPEEGRYYLRPGHFMVCWPKEAHKVAMMKDAPASIRKMVCKIKVGGISDEIV